jgi:hypothetical protein
VVGADGMLELKMLQKKIKNKNLVILRKLQEQELELEQEHVRDSKQFKK